MSVLYFQRKSILGIASTSCNVINAKEVSQGADKHFEFLGSVLSVIDKSMDSDGASKGENTATNRALARKVGQF